MTQTRPANDGDLEPIVSDLEASSRLVREAVYQRPWVGENGNWLAERYERRLRAGSVDGRLLRVGGRPVGIVTWERRGTLGLAVELLFVSGSEATLSRYRSFLEGIERTAGRVVFAPGAISGLSSDEEARLMREMGHAPYGRSEMQRKGDSPVPHVELPAGGVLRPVGRDDERELVALHQRAYRGRFDRFLFLEHEDEEEDSRALVRDLWAGRWGEPSEPGSRGLEVGGVLWGAILSVRRPPGVLIADVMVDPSRQGQGVGRAMLSGTLRILSDAGQSPVVLSVTEGNHRAIRLYERFGFVRTLGPSHDWYNARRIPVPPDGG
jgi:ribosomal protein S18 acetylase RimI-like enzyme